MDNFSNMRIIEEMLYTARKEVRDNGAFFLLWGWLVFIAAAVQILIGLFNLGNATFHITDHIAVALDGLSWAILMPLGGIVSVIMSKRQRNEERVRTWFDDLMKYLWIAFGVVLGITLFMMGYLNINMYPVIMSLYGLGLFVTGGALKFRPLLLGGIFCWVFGFASIFCSGIYPVVFLAASVLFGYIVPGYMLQKQFRKDVQAA